jgi:integrase
LIAGWLDTHPIPILTDADVKNYVLSRRDGRIKCVNSKTKFVKVGVRDKTILNEIQILCGIIDEAIKLKMVSVNVARSVSVRVKSSRIRRSLTLLEISALLQAVDANCHLMHGQIREFILFALFTGWRRGELRAITWDDINFESRKLIVQSKFIEGEGEFTVKSGTARSMSIPDKLMPVIEGMERKGRFLFGGDAPRNIDSISQVVRLVMRRAGIVGTSLHTCRHTFGSWILRQTGGDLKATQELLGHLDISTTANYMHNILDGNDPSRSLSYE